MDQNQRIKKLEIKLQALVFLLILVLAGGAVVIFPGLKNAALALSGNYNKTTGESLELSDWNNLDDDFLDKSGDAMGGDLNMGGNIISNVGSPTADTDVANRAYVLDQISSMSAVQDFSGNSVKMVCGTTDSVWQDYNNPSSPNTIFKIVNITSANFSNTPTIFSNIAGTNYHFKSIGGTSVYFPSKDEFTIYAAHLTQALSAANAALWNWKINWCAVGN